MSPERFPLVSSPDTALCTVGPTSRSVGLTRQRHGFIRWPEEKDSEDEEMLGGEESFATCTSADEGAQWRGQHTRFDDDEEGEDEAMPESTIISADGARHTHPTTVPKVGCIGFPHGGQVPYWFDVAWRGRPGSRIAARHRNRHCCRRQEHPRQGRRNSPDQGAGRRGRRAHGGPDRRKFEMTVLAAR